jgi:hypothetical protein
MISVRFLKQISFVLLFSLFSINSFSSDLIVDEATETSIGTDDKYGKRKRNSGSSASRRALKRQTKRAQRSIHKNHKRNKRLLRYRNQKQKKQHKYSKIKTFRY